MGDNSLSKQNFFVKSTRPSLPVSRSALRSGGAWRLVYQSLRDDIVAMRLAPGYKISESELARRFGISRTPVREAIQRLADEGLVEIFPQSGTFVARIPYDALPEAMVIRKALEQTTAALAAGKATRSQTLILASVVEQQREAAQRNDSTAFHRADELFHSQIAEISGFPGIWRLVLQVKTQVDRFRHLTLALPDRMVAVIKEHEAVLDAIQRKDSDAARDAMLRHLDGVLPAIDQLPDTNTD
nr:GntR family transcriptional regulator [Devosia geojensis]